MKKRKDAVKMHLWTKLIFMPSACIYPFIFLNLQQILKIIYSTVLCKVFGMLDFAKGGGGGDTSKNFSFNVFNISKYSLGVIFQGHFV